MFRASFNPRVKTLVGAALLTSGLSMAPVATAGQEPDYWDAIGAINITFGGDELVELMVEDFFGDNEKEEINAGELFSLAGGLAFQIPMTSIQLQGTIGYHVDGIFADNGDVEFARYPVELLALYRFNKHRVGFGVTEHLNPKLELDFDFGPEVATKYRDAFGLIVQYDYRISTYFALGLRYVDIEYEVKNNGYIYNSSQKVDGSHIGISGTFFW